MEDEWDFKIQCNASEFVKKKVDIFCQRLGEILRQFKLHYLIFVLWEIKKWKDGRKTWCHVNNYKAPAAIYISVVNIIVN